jgi:hypothetical protein
MNTQVIEGAKEALELIKNGKFIPLVGRYLTANQTPEFTGLFYGGPDDELKDIVNKVPMCSGCGIAAMFIGMLNKFDELKAKDLNKEYHFHGTLFETCMIHSKDIRNYLTRFMSQEQIELIECAFECCAGFYKGNDDKGYHAEQWGRQYAVSLLRLIAILENIIEHGEFRYGFQSTQTSECGNAGA